VIINNWPINIINRTEEEEEEGRREAIIRHLEG